MHSRVAIQRPRILNPSPLSNNSRFFSARVTFRLSLLSLSKRSFVHGFTLFFAFRTLALGCGRGGAMGNRFGQSMHTNPPVPSDTMWFGSTLFTCCDTFACQSVTVSVLHVGAAGSNELHRASFASYHARIAGECLYRFTTWSV